MSIFAVVDNFTLSCELVGDQMRGFTPNRVSDTLSNTEKRIWLWNIFPIIYPFCQSANTQRWLADDIWLYVFCFHRAHWAVCWVFTATREIMTAWRWAETSSSHWITTNPPRASTSSSKSATAWPMAIPLGNTPTRKCGYFSSLVWDSDFFCVKSVWGKTSKRL